MGHELIFAGVTHIAAERLGEELIRGRSVLFAVSEEDIGTIPDRRSRRFGHESGLALPSLTGDQSYLVPLVPSNALDCIQDQLHLVLAADQANGGLQHIEASRYLQRGGSHCLWCRSPAGSARKDD